MTYPHDGRDEVDRPLAVHIISASTTLVGVCLTVIGALWVVNRLQGLDTMAGQVLAVDALVSLGACALAYASLRTRGSRRARTIERAADAAFLLAIALMTVACGLIAYTIV